MLEPLAAAGVDRVVLWMPPAARDEVAPRMERFASLARDMAGGTG